MSQIYNWQVFQRDPRDTTIPNDGVSEVGNPQTEAEWNVLRYELSNFVCEGEYHRGLERILSTYLTHAGRETQPAVWVSGFYGSGKSHLVRVLEYLWRDLTFPDGATARGLVTLPSDIEAQLRELSTLGKRGGGLWSASGTLGEGAGPSVRLAILGIIFQAAGLPTSYEQASFVLYLKQHKVYEVVRKAVEDSGHAFAEELRNLFVSPILASAVLEALPGVVNSSQEFRALLREQYKKVSDVSEEDFLQTITAVLSLESGDSQNLPYTVLVLDEVQQYLDHYPENTLHVQTVVQALSKRFGSRVLCVATGQSALMAHSELQKLKDRFTVHVELSDSDVEQVLRQVVLRKASTHTDDVKEVLTETSGEIDRHLQGTKVAASAADKAVLISDYPLLPSRRRFWEKALRAMDKAGSAGQLRTQLRMVHEATKLVADKPLGNVVAGDFVYDQQSAVMLQSGVILKEIEETIREMRGGTPEGNLKSRLCALIFTISQLPREPGTDSGVRSNATTLADLLVTDLTAGSDTLRQQVPERLKELVEAGILLKTSDEAGDEYKLQTKESAEWEQSFKSSYQKAFADDGRLATDRNQRLRESLQEQLKRVRLPQGKSKTPRTLDLHFGANSPDIGKNIPVWLRDEWSVSEKAVQQEAQAAGTENPVVFVSIPRQQAEDLKRNLAQFAAAEYVMRTKGSTVQTSPEGVEAKKGMDNRLAEYGRNIGAIMEGLVNSARVYQGGGSEVIGTHLSEAVQRASEAAVVRLYPEFDTADHDKWDRVIKRAKDGNNDPLSVVDYAGETKDHPAAYKVMQFIGGSGKRGSEVRQHFSGAPYGWPQDAIDGSLYALLAADLISASLNGSPKLAKTLTKPDISSSVFKAQHVVLSTGQRIKLRSLFSEMGINAASNAEQEAAPKFIDKMLELANQAGGDPPAPAKPNTVHLETARNLTGNEQLMELFNSQDRLKKEIAEWKATKSTLEARLPRWKTLEKLLEYADGLDAHDRLVEQVQAIEASRSLTSDPDPVPPLSQEVSAALREKLSAAYSAYNETYHRLNSELTSSETWQQLPGDEAKYIRQQNSLKVFEEPLVGTDDALLSALSAMSFSELESQTAALPGRTQQARLAAEKFLEPRSVQLKHPGVTLKTEAEVDEYLTELKELIMFHIDDGSPVIL